MTIKHWNHYYFKEVDRMIDIQIKQDADKHLRLTDYLSRYPRAGPKPIENYDEEYVINCVIHLLEFINNYGSFTDENETTTQTDQKTNSHKTKSQSETRHVQKLQTSEIKGNNCSSLLPVRNSILKSNHTNYHFNTKETDIETVESFEREDPSKETLKLTRR